MKLKMINLTNEQKQYLSSYIEDIESLIITDDVQLFLDRIDDEIVNIILGNDEPNEDVVKLQNIYDQIYNEN